ncbi:MAG TPA: hypothetical protein VHQ96_11560 [Gaiellaceae bacterium]|nr:hypothetical protein [Gaiellaceae bacterium]
MTGHLPKRSGGRGRTAAERVQQELGGADILVNKAGLMLTAPCLGRPGRLLSQGTA